MIAPLDELDEKRSASGVTTERAPSRTTAFQGARQQRAVPQFSLTEDVQPGPVLQPGNIVFWM